MKYEKKETEGEERNRINHRLALQNIDSLILPSVYRPHSMYIKYMRTINMHIYKLHVCI